MRQGELLLQQQQQHQLDEAYELIDERKHLKDCDVST